MNTRGIYLLLALSALLARLNARSERGATMVDYGLIVAMVAVLGTGIVLLQDAVVAVFNYHCENKQNWRCSP